MQTELVENTLLKAIEDFSDSLDTDEKKDIISKKEEIVQMLMKGRFKDLGGIVAMRGFIYQYYVAMYYILEMLHEKKVTWWDCVILEYFDDVTLLSKNKIRFIQVKTVRERSKNKHTPSNFTTREKLSKPKEDKERFNSWVEKIFLNYDFFLEDRIDDGYGANISKDDFQTQFEIVTNSPTVTLDGLDDFTTNVSFSLKRDIQPDNKIKKKILEPVVFKIEDAGHEKSKPIVKEIHFKHFSKKEIDFYLKRLYINQFGSSIELQQDIIAMIKEVLDLKGYRAPSIAEYIFENLFSNVIKRCINDNEQTLRKDDLVIKKDDAVELLKMWKAEIRERLSKESFEDTAYGLFEKACENLKEEIVSDYAKKSIQEDLIETLGWLRETVKNEFEKNPDYCITFLNKLFNTNETLTKRDFESSKNKLFLTESLRYLVTFLSFYSKKHLALRESKLIFHIGESDFIKKANISIYHARNNKTLIESKNRVVTIYNDNIGKLIDEDICCLVIGSEKSSEIGDSSPVASKLLTNYIPEEEPSILTVPDKVYFLNINEFESFLGVLKQSNFRAHNIQDETVLSVWDSELKKMLEKQ
ncbi:dsDNA nuclease domain-containing protein [Sporosarcina sp. FSL K6-1522]|uniref:dsDNA nuclease domain-containing protein n=1 Tax=Sporosarcina sp. FSL K6-1522 TaxID=2921554 RepID=UPI00315B2F96